MTAIGGSGDSFSKVNALSQAGLKVTEITGKTTIGKIANMWLSRLQGHVCFKEGGKYYAVSKKEIQQYKINHNLSFILPRSVVNKAVQEGRKPILPENASLKASDEKLENVVKKSFPPHVKEGISLVRELYKARNSKDQKELEAMEKKNVEVVQSVLKKQEEMKDRTAVDLLKSGIKGEQFQMSTSDFKKLFNIIGLSPKQAQSAMGYMGVLEGEEGPIDTAKDEFYMAMEPYVEQISLPTARYLCTKPVDTPVMKNPSESFPGKHLSRERVEQEKKALGNPPQNTSNSLPETTSSAFDELIEMKQSDRNAFSKPLTSDERLEGYKKSIEKQNQLSPSTDKKVTKSLKNGNQLPKLDNI